MLKRDRLKSCIIRVMILSLIGITSCSVNSHLPTEEKALISYRETIIIDDVISQELIPEDSFSEHANAEDVMNEETVLEENMPDIDSFFSRMTIEVPANSHEQYIVGDNISGYYDGLTHCYSPSNNYKRGDSTVIHSYMTFTNSILNNRNASSFELIYPWGSTNQYTSGVEESWMLHNYENAFSYTVHSPEPGILGIHPGLLVSLSRSEIKFQDGVVLIVPHRIRDNGIPQVIAITADSSFEFIEHQEGLFSELQSILGKGSSEFSGVLQSVNPVTDFTVHLAFGLTEEEAIEKAVRMRTSSSMENRKQYWFNYLTKNYLETPDTEYNKALLWASYSAYSLVVEEFGKGIWAGLPWFRDNWGRDTFIALPGTLLTSGKYEEAKDVLNNFAGFQNLGELELSIDTRAIPIDRITSFKAFLKEHYSLILRSSEEGLSCDLPRSYLEGDRTALCLELESDLKTDFSDFKLVFNYTRDADYGRIPNRVNSESMIYNTTDGTPWFIREAYEYMQYSGDLDYAREILPLIEIYMEGCLENYVDSDGFLVHSDADTWMDARIRGNQPWSARGSRAIEIQTLWYETLLVSSRIADMSGREDEAAEWQAMADRLKNAFNSRFYDAELKVFADRLRADDSADFMIRPNQLMVLSIPTIESFTSPEREAIILKNAVSELLFPYGITSLSQHDSYFHPYHHNDGSYHFDAAYHNGTIWGWNAGFSITGLLKYGYSDLAYRLSKNLSNQILTMGALGSMSENIDAFPDENNQINLSGTFSQSWSLSEFARNGFQDYVGFNPRLLDNKLILKPAIPKEWDSFFSRLTFGSDEDYLLVSYHRSSNSSTQEQMKFLIKAEISAPILLEFCPVLDDGSSIKSLIMLASGLTEIGWDSTGKVTVEGREIDSEWSYVSQKGIIGDLDFAQPDLSLVFPVLEEKNYLEQIIKAGNYDSIRE